jgi:hypothetical protein
MESMVAEFAGLGVTVHAIHTPKEERFASKKVVAKLFILKRTSRSLSSGPVWVPPSQVLFGS